MRLELILAGFEIFARLEHEHAADENPRLIDHPFADKNIGDVVNTRAARNIDHAVLRQWSRSIEPLFAEDQRCTGGDRYQDEDAEDGVADNDERMPRTLGAASLVFERYPVRARFAGCAA